MLELTLTTGTELKIGDDIRIVFRGDTSTGRMKVSVEAPKDKRIERVKPVEGQTKKQGVFLVGNTKYAAERTMEEKHTGKVTEMR